MSFDIKSIRRLSDLNVNLILLCILILYKLLFQQLIKSNFINFGLRV